MTLARSLSAARSSHRCTLPPTSNPPLSRPFKHLVMRVFDFKKDDAPSQEGKVYLITGGASSELCSLAG